MKFLFSLLIIICLFSCKEKDSGLTADAIITKAIEFHCSGNCERATIDFTFRDKQYRSTRNGGKYRLERITQDSIGEILDVVSNNGFQRFINDSSEVLADSTALILSDAVNSVHYFAQLPYGLNAPAVQKKLLGETKIKGDPYYEIEVRFSEEGGGTDFDDVFVYWVHKDLFRVDYLAYKYAVNGGGIRFREAFNSRVIESIRFVDYNNYKPQTKTEELSELDTKFENGELELLSKIETEAISVKLRKD